jgi:hypothetical protein
MTLGDPWYPIVLSSSVATVPPRADHVVELSTRAPQIVASGSGVTTTAGAPAIVRFEARAVSHAPVVILPTDREIVRDRDAAVQLTLVSDAAEVELRSPFDLDSESTLGPFDIDAAGMVHATVRDCIALLRRIHFTASSPDVGRVGGMRDALVVVEVPERQRLAVSVPGMLLVSDHAFRVAPVDRVRRLHGGPIARAAFAALLTPHLRAASRLSDAAWSADLDGALLADRLLRDVASIESLSDPGVAAVKSEGTADLVKAFGFNRSVDSLIYAPRIAFGAQMFQVIDEPDPDRTGADRARNVAPMGRFLLEKLRDRLGVRFGEAAALHLGEGLDWRAAAQRVSAIDLDVFWSTWASEHRRVAYRLDGMKSHSVPTGVETTMSVRRLGDSWIREPVVVEICDVDAHCARATWDEDGPQGQVTVVTPGAFDDARVDPESRLSQDPTLTDGHPRFDDTITHAWKPPLIGGFSAAYSESEHRYELNMAILLRRQFDLDGGWISTATDGARGWGGSFARAFDFGGKRDLNGRFGEWIFGVSGLRSPQGFGRQTNPQTSGALFASVSWDSVLQAVDPMTGYGAIASAALNFEHDDGGSTKPTIVLSARAHVDMSGVLFEVGLGARLLVDWAGIQPGTLVFDFGVPLLRPDAIVRDATGAFVRERERYGFWFGFVQIL